MDISNKTLGLLLVAAIVVSVGGTFLSLQQLGSLSATGYATSDTGLVNLTVEEVLSIELIDSVIDFGQCTPHHTDDITVDSSLAAGAVNNSACSATGAFPDYLRLRNAGNVHACVDMQTDRNADDLFGTDGVSSIWYKVENATAPGCAGTMQDAYNQLTLTGANDYPVCTNLTAIASFNQIDFFIQAIINPNAKDGGQMTLTINAADAGVGC